jgi:hypothetical protein
MMQAEGESKRSLSQQLFEAYTASLRPEEEAKSDDVMMPGKTRVFRKVNVAKPSPTLVDGLGINTLLAQTENVTFIPPRLYQLDVTTIEAWNQIGDLANDVGHSAIIRQAEILNYLVRQDSRSRGEGNVLRQEEQEEGVKVNAKKRKFKDSISVEKTSHKNTKIVVVSESSEEEVMDDSSCDEEKVAIVSSPSPSSIDRNSSGDVILQEHVDRIIRMTTYVSELERIHALIGAEMQAMKGFQEK